MAANDQRSARLNRLLDNVLNGKTTLDTPTKCKQFIEAICTHPDPPRCVERLIESTHGLRSVQEAICNDLSIEGINERGVGLLSYIQDPAIKTLKSGQTLIQMLNAIVEASTFWTAFATAFKEQKLNEPGQKCFAWALLHLIPLPSETVSPHLALANAVESLLLHSPYVEVRNLGQKIIHAISVSSSPLSPIATQDDLTPGGRHDNDFVEFRDIAILPTADELASTEAPFLRPSAALDDPRTEDNRGALYLDNQFRLLREDMIHEMREELQIAMGKQPGKKHRGFVVEGLQIHDCDLGNATRRNKWSLIMQCKDEFPEFHKLSLAKRKDYLKERPRFLKNQSLTALIVDGEAVAFPSLRRDEALLIKSKPQIVLELDEKKAMRKLLLRMKSAKHVKLIQIDVAVFAYEPILNALKSMSAVPLSADLLFWKQGALPGRVALPPRLQGVVNWLRTAHGIDVGRVLSSVNKTVVLDNAQEKALLAGLTQSVSIIQGPPGTGKSFIGTLLAKFIYDFSDLKILVVCFTNHALDQFLEDLLDIGIESESMVRIGWKSTTRTEPMLLQGQQTDFRFTPSDRSVIGGLKSEIEIQAQTLSHAFKQYLQSSTGNADLMSYLEFADGRFHAAFQVPESEDGMTAVGRGGRSVDEFYLLERWRTGANAGIYLNMPNVQKAHDIWALPRDARQALVDRWIGNIDKEEVKHLAKAASRYNMASDELRRKFKEKDSYILGSKRIIGCTTTAAAKYTRNIHDAAPDIVLVEEAGEILESHIVTALGRAAKQLILIGDHKQLRPKVNNYNLTVEKGEGYNLNMSLFERLVLKGYPHDTLVAQHRMRPEISSLIRHLTYPDLLDAPRTTGRPNIRGVQNNVIFVNHEHAEGELSNVADIQDTGSKATKQNPYEARMVLKIVKYLAQQGYGTDEMVVLTPYLGQLHKLRQELKAETDPVLNDLDSFDLIRAGLLTPGAAGASKGKLRLATIDNYQGEESDIIIASLTRSNASHDIGFMTAPERLNVLLSRARNGLIMIGNSNTFKKSKKGGALWQKFFAHIQNQVYGGFPVKCEQHPRRTALLSSEIQFEEHSPEGGCTEPCGTFLACGVHKCTSKCHQLYDHSKIRCNEVVTILCPKAHSKTKKCFERVLLGCVQCQQEAKAAEVKRQQEIARQQKRAEEKAAHLRKLKEIEDRIAEELRIAKRREEERKRLAEYEASPFLGKVGIIISDFWRRNTSSSSS